MYKRVFQIASNCE